MKKTNKKTGLYPYTLQPIALAMSEQEFQKAQLALFEKSAESYHLKAVKPKEWGILGVVVALAILGLVMVKGYSVIIFWLMLVGVGLYLLARTLGLKWYVQREYQKQVSQTPMPEQMHSLKLGVQSHGLIMTLPMDNAQINSTAMRGMTLRTPLTQQGVIPWSAVLSWDTTDEFVFIMFELHGQRGSQIIPKRLNQKGLPIDTIIKHLSDTKPKGLTPDSFTQT